MYDDNDPYAELKEVLNIAFGLLTDEQWDEYQRIRREKFMDRVNKRKDQAA